MDQTEKRRPWAFRSWSREAVLLTALAALGILFGIAQGAVGLYRSTQSDLAKSWFQRGNAALAARQPNEAIVDLQNALSYNPDDPTYQLRLAQALAAANRINEAESYLLILWDKQPGSGEINLELARLEARKNSPDAARYYYNAIYGVWYGEGKESPLERRWQARMELVQYWFAHHNLPQAQSVLLALAANVAPDDFKRHTLVGQLQLKADDPRNALQQFQAALRSNRGYAPALAGAGEAEFDLGDYRGALPYLERAVRLDPKNQKAKSQFELARMVLDDDPFQIGLGDRERVNRTLDAYLQALSALESCATTENVALDSETPENPLQKAWANGQQLLPLMTDFHGRPSSVLQLMKFVFSAENVAASECGPLKGKDQALWLIGKVHQLGENSGQNAA